MTNDDAAPDPPDVGALLSGGRRGTIAKSAHTRRRILGSAAKLFAQRGYQETRLSDIAQGAGMGTGAIHYYFASKADLAEAVISLGTAETFARARAAVSALPEVTDPVERLRVAVAAHVESIMEVENFAALKIMGQVPNEVLTRTYNVQREYGDFLDELYRAAMSQGSIRDDIEPVTLRLLVTGTMNWAHEWPSRSAWSPDEIASTFNSVIFDGLHRSQTSLPREQSNAQHPATSPPGR